MADANMNEIDLENLDRVAGGASRQAGITCPVCGGFIPASQDEIFTAGSIHCSNCGNDITINQQESKPAMWDFGKFMKPQ